MASGLLQTVDEHTRLAGHNRLALLLFDLGVEQVFGINVFKVREVIRCPALVGMPGAHAAVRGCADIRGQTVSVIDLGRAVGLPALTELDDAYVIVSEFNRSVQGFLVRAVDRIVHRDGTDVAPPPAGATLGAFVNAVTRVDGGLVGLVDVEQVMADVAGEAVTKLSSRLKPVEGQPTVLVADDSALARGRIKATLDDLGVDCVFATNGSEALDWLNAADETPAMLVSDIEMPFMDGYALTRAIRADERLRHLPVVLHTSLSGSFNQSLVDRVGADRFIAKFAPEALAKGVLEILAQAE